MQKVLIATDGSATAQLAAHFLARLPHDGKLELTVVSVLTPVYSPMLTLPADWIDETLERDRKQATEAFTEISTVFEGANASIEHVIIQGHAGESICNEAKSRGCDLVVMGAKGHSTVSRILLGSTSDYVGTHASCSVLVVRPTEPARSTHPLRIALGYEESDPAQAALEEIAEIKWGSRIEFHLVTVSYLFGSFVNPVIERMRQSCREAAKRLHKSGLNTQSHFIEDEHLGEGLVKYAEDHGCDILVVGETPRGLVGRALMGSTSRYVLRHAPCSVWIGRNRMSHRVTNEQPLDAAISS